MDVKLGGGLDVVPRLGSSWQLVADQEGSRTVALRLDAAEHRCRLGLALFGGARIVDVSRDPAAFFNALRSAADLAGEPRERWASALGTALDRLGRENGWWEERRSGRVEHTALVAAWPLLRRADLQPDDPVSLPRWTTGLFAGPDPRSAVARALGDRASRRVTRLVGRRLSGRPSWWPLALALAMPRLDAGQIGDVLDGLDDDFRCDDDQFALLRRTIGVARPDLAVRLLQSASRENSPQRLLDGLDGVARARELIPRLPTTLPALELSVAESLAAPPPPGAPRAPRPVTARRRQRQSRARSDRPAARAAVPRAAAPAAARQRPAPAAMPDPQSWRTTDEFDHPPSWKALDGTHQGEVQLRLPHSAADLNRWGFALHNCLGSYKGRVDDGRSLILGIFVRGELGGAVEVDPAKRRIVQISAIKGRPLPRATQQTVIAMLLSRGVVARARAGRTA